MVNIYDLARQGQAAEMLGVTPQRVGQIRAEVDDFPKPVYDENRIVLWRKQDIRDWGRNNGYIKRY